MPQWAEVYGSLFVCHQLILVLRCTLKVSVETCNTRRTRYYLGLEHIKVSYKVWHDLLTLIAVAGDLDFSEDKAAHSCLPSSL